MGGARDDTLHQLTIFLFAWIIRRSGQVDDDQRGVMWLGNYQFIEFNAGVHTTNIILMPEYMKEKKIYCQAQNKARAEGTTR